MLPIYSLMYAFTTLSALRYIPKTFVCARVCQQSDANGQQQISLQGKTSCVDVLASEPSGN